MLLRASQELLRSFSGASQELLRISSELLRSFSGAPQSLSGASQTVSVVFLRVSELLRSFKNASLNRGAAEYRKYYVKLSNLDDFRSISTPGCSEASQELLRSFSEPLRSFSDR